MNNTVSNTVKLAYINTISRLSVAFVYFYHGLIPKIIWLDDVEVLMDEAHNIGIKSETIALIGGITEITLSLAIIFFKKSLLPIYLAIGLFVVLLIDVAIMLPELLIKAFNPLTINTVCLALCLIVIISHSDLVDD